MNRNTLLISVIALVVLPGLVPAKTQPVLSYTPPEQGFVWDWLLSFRHSYPYSYVGASMEYDALAGLGGERKIKPAEGMPAGEGSNWQAYHHELGSGFTGPIMVFPPASMYMTYAATYLVCDQAVTNLSLRTGSDDGLLVILNGEIVQKVQMQRGYNVDQDRADGLALRKGWNTLLCKVDDYMGGHGLCVRFMTAAGEPVTDYRVVLVPEPPAGVLVEFVDGRKYEAEAIQLLKQAITQKTVNNDIAAALATARAVVTKYPASKTAAEALYVSAGILRDQGKTDEAHQAYDAVLTDFPFSKWAEDSLMAKGTEAALERVLKDYGNSALVPEAMLRLADIKTRAQQFIEGNSILEELRSRFPQTLESVQALDKLADNKAATGDRAGAQKLWQQVIEEAATLTAGKYVWYVNVQSALKEVADGARTKKEGK